MLALLAEGASTSTLARKMRHSEGTVRVYLHRLYKAIGVRNRTEAVLWQLKRGAHPPGADLPVAAKPDGIADESFGGVALREGLHPALGIMESFLGPYGRIWQAAMRLKGAAIDPGSLARREQARLLWRALLQGDFACGKRLHDERGQQLPASASAAEGMLLALLLQIGGYSRAADQVMSRLLRKSAAGQAVSVREAQLLRAVRGAMQESAGESLASLQRLASQGSGAAVLRQIAMVALFHVSRALKDAGRARAAADALWAEAEAARSQLEAMGIRPLPRSPAMPRSGQAGLQPRMQEAKAVETAR